MPWINDRSKPETTSWSHVGKQMRRRPCAVALAERSCGLDGPTLLSKAWLTAARTPASRQESSIGSPHRHGRAATRKCRCRGPLLSSNRCSLRIWSAAQPEAPMSFRLQHTAEMDCGLPPGIASAGTGSRSGRRPEQSPVHSLGLRRVLTNRVREPARRMSAIKGSADSNPTPPQVRKVPQPDSCTAAFTSKQISLAF
jgi:hypothetical protein